MPPPAPPIVKLGRTTHGQADLGDDALGVGDRVRVVAARHVEADALHRLGEELAVLALLDDVELRADELDAVLLERAGLGERDRAVQAGLAAERRQQRVGLLGGDDLLDELGRDRLDVGAVRESRVGHDRGRVAVDEHDLEPVVAQHLARLRARVVELAGLADDDRPGADHEDLLDVGAAGHVAPVRFRCAFVRCLRSG